MTYRGRSSTFDAEMNIDSLTKMDANIYDIAEKALQAIGSYPASRQRLQAIVDEFRQNVILNNIQREQDFLNEQMNVTAQTNNIYDFPPEVTSLAKGMHEIMKNLGYDHSNSSNFLLSLFKPLHEVFVQEKVLISSQETRFSNAINNFFIKNSCNEIDKHYLSKLSNLLQEKGYKKPFKFKK